MAVIRQYTAVVILIALLLLLVNVLVNRVHGSLPAYSSAALVPSPALSLEQRVSTLEARVEGPSKDIWDKINAISGLVSGILIALIGGAAMLSLAW